LNEREIHLFAEWRDGAEILAGACLLSTVPQPVRVGRDCDRPGCHITVFGDSEREASGRLLTHWWRCHA
jgi:hypothetical protein